MVAHTTNGERRNRHDPPENCFSGTQAPPASTDTGRMSGLRRWIAVLLPVAAVLAGGVAVPGAARADGDPASDYLPTLDLFVPLAPPAARNLQKDLDNLVFAARRRGYVVKIAVIGSRTDLGAVPQLFGRPQTYAKFLGSELRFTYRGRLLVVMPQGIGTRNVPAREVRALRAVAIAASSPDDLVRTGMRIVRAGAAAGGISLPVLPATPAAAVPPPAPAPTVHSAPPPAAVASPARSRTTRLAVVGSLAAALLLASGGMLAWWWRQREATLEPDSSSQA
jgi:hypothetical protein